MPLMPAPEEWSYVVPGTLVAESDLAEHPDWVVGDPLWGDVDVVRFYLQDTNPGVRLLPDLELQYLVDEWFHRYDSLIYVAAEAAETVSTKFAGVVSVSADGVSVNVADISERYAAAAARLRQRYKDAQVGGEIDITNMMWDQMPDWAIEPLSFGLGMHDNREAGRQQYAGQSRYGGGYYGEDELIAGV